MRTRRFVEVVLVFLLVLGLSAPALARQKKTFRADLDGFQEVPAISTTGHGEFRATISNDETMIEFELSYGDLEGGSVTAAHIHLGQPGVAGGVSAFLCGGGGKSPCPPSGTVQGTIIASDVMGPTNQGIGAGELDELIEAIREGMTYANVHTSLPSTGTGEIRGQIE